MHAARSSRMVSSGGLDGRHGGKHMGIDANAERTKKTQCPNNTPTMKEKKTPKHTSSREKRFWSEKIAPQLAQSIMAFGGFSFAFDS